MFFIFWGANMWSSHFKISIARKLILASLFLVYFSSANANLTDACKIGQWTGFVRTLSGYEPAQAIGDIISGGVMRIPPSLSSDSYYWTHFRLAIPSVFSGDNAKLEVKVKNPPSEGGIGAYDTSIWVVGNGDGVTDKGAGVVLMGDGWGQYWDGLYAVDSSVVQIPELVIPLDNWHTIAIESKNGVLSVYNDNVKIKDLAYIGQVGKIKYIDVSFKGSGSLDEVKLYADGQLVLQDTFDSVLSAQVSCNKVETVTISGQINVGAKAAQDVRLSVSGDGFAEFCPVDTSGKFNCQIPKGWTGYLIPESTSITFTPKTLHVSDIQKDIDAVEINGEMVVEVLKIEPTDALKSKFTVFTVTGTNLTEGSIKFDLAGCKPSNLEFEPENATTTQRRFRCMPTATGGKIGRILSTADDKLLKMFRVQVAAKPPKVTDISPKNVLFGEDTLFTVTGTDLVADLVYSLNECDKMQEVGAGTATKRYFQCTPKNSEGKQFGKVSLKDGTLIKDFSVNVSSSVKVKSVAAKLSYFSKPSLFSCLGGTLCGNFPLGDFIDTATFSSDTHWYIKANGKKIYSGTLGDTFKGVFHFNSGETHIDLKANEGTISFSWDKQKKLINFNLTGGLQLLKPELAGKPTIEIGFATIKAAFSIDLLKQPKNAVVKAAAWSYDGRNVDSVNFLTQETIALRQARIEQYVYPDINRKIRWLNNVNSKTMAKNKLAKEVAENLNEALSYIKLIPYVGFKPVDKDAGLELIKLFTNYSFSVRDNAGFTEALIGKFSSSFSENIIDFESGGYLGVAGVVANLSFSTYETMIDALSAFKLNENLEAIYAHEIAKEVINQYFANGGSIYSLASQVLPNAKPSEKTWENVIRAIASNLDCRVNARCTIDLFSEDYEPELVNRLVQNYLATLRVLAGYGEFYLHNSP
ncbi:MAG: hypothetical protein NTV43_15200 [Methylococcales bacterium]|nr:hypothetical protein [Methylococcales bacterium]